MANSRGDINVDEGNKKAASGITQKRFGCGQVFGLLVLAVIVTAGVTVFIFKFYFFPSEFKPVALNPGEEKALALKLEKIDALGAGLLTQKKDPAKKVSESERPDSTAPLAPEPYDESGATREIRFSERELNALLAKNTDLAKKMAIDLSDGLVSAKLLLPIDEDFPVLGGKILRVRSGVAFAYKNGKPVVILKGITIMGVPVPNAWLGGLKNIDLVERFDTQKGFWKTFAAGVEDIKVEEGRLTVKLKE